MTTIPAQKPRPLDLSIEVCEGPRGWHYSAASAFNRWYPDLINAEGYPSREEAYEAGYRGATGGPVMAYFICRIEHDIEVSDLK